MKSLLWFLGLDYDNNLDTTPSPFKKKKWTKKNTKVDNPDMTWTPITGQAYVKEDVQDGRKWTKDGHVELGQLGQLDTTEREYVQSVNLDIDKASTLKPYWVGGYSAYKASKQFPGKRGYSQRTIEKYWAAFNAFERGESG